jgi:DUF971 family protein
VDDRTQAIDIDVVRDVGVTITFADDYLAEFNLTELRLSCPCAECRNMRANGDESWPTPSSPKPLRISDVELHGGWGLRIEWNDGHGTGIFPFRSLRSWAEKKSHGA